MVATYTDGFSDTESDRSRAGIFVTQPDGEAQKTRSKQRRFLFLNFTCEFIAIKKALNLYLMDKMLCTFDGIIIFSNCTTTLEAVKNDKTKVTQDVNTLLNLIMERMESCTLQWIPTQTSGLPSQGSKVSRFRPFVNYTLRCKYFCI